MVMMATVTILYYNNNNNNNKLYYDYHHHHYYYYTVHDYDHPHDHSSYIVHCYFIIQYIMTIIIIIAIPATGRQAILQAYIQAGGNRQAYDQAHT